MRGKRKCCFRFRAKRRRKRLRAWCAHSGHTISLEYVEHESGRKGADKRKQFAALFEDAAKKKFECVLFWALDRFSREGMAQTIVHLQRLTSCGVSFHSYTEPHLSTDNELVRNILLALLSSLAKVEAQKIGERTKAGMAEQGPRASRLADRGLQLKFVKKSQSGLLMAKHPTPLLRRLELTGTRQRSMRPKWRLPGACRM